MKTLCIDNLFVPLEEVLAAHLVNRGILFPYKGHLYFSPNFDDIEQLTLTLVKGAYNDGHQRTAAVHREGA